jgi:prevent-host-death family protein
VKVAKLSDVKNELSRYVELVRKGGRVRILVSGVPAADIVPIDEASADWTPDLVALERSGTIRRGKAGVARELLKRVDEGRVKQIFDAEREDRLDHR